MTCEHGGNRIPARWKALFRGRGKLLDSHAGWDAGALLLARLLSLSLRGELIHSTTSRLLIDLNRSPGHSRLYSAITRDCSAADRDSIRRNYYDHYREMVTDFIDRALRRGRRVLHISAHSFTPSLNGVRRNADIGLLYDPARAHESRFCLRLAEELHSRQPAVRVRRNYPYRGAADGFTTFLRRQYPSKSYAGIEIEVNQSHASRPAGEWAALRCSIRDSISAAIGGPASPRASRNGRRGRRPSKA